MHLIKTVLETFRQSLIPIQKQLKLLTKQLTPTVTELKFVAMVQTMFPKALLS